MSEVLRKVSGRAVAALSGALFACSNAAQAQVACQDGANTEPCIVAPGTTIQFITNNVDGASVDNQGSITADILTNGDDSPVTISGFAGNDVRTNGDFSPITNSGTVRFSLSTFGDFSPIINSGTTGSSVQTSGANSPVINSGSVGTLLRTFGSNSPVTNTGSVGQSLITQGVNSGVTNSGSVTFTIFTQGKNSGVTNSGFVGGEIRTLEDNSGVNNSGFVGNDLVTQGDNSSVTNSGTVVFALNTLGDNSDVFNSGSVLGNIGTTGDNTRVINSGFVGNGILMDGRNPNLTLLPGSVILGDLDLSGAGTRTLNVGNGLSVALTFVTPPDIVNSFGAPFVLAGNKVAVVDPTALSQHDEMLADLTSGVFNSIHARLAGVGGSLNSGFEGMSLGTGSMMGLGGPMMRLGTQDISPSASNDKGGVWAQAFGGYRNEDGGRGTVGSDSEHYGGIAGVDGSLVPGIRIGAFGGGSRGELETAFDSQDLDVDSYFGGGYASLRQSGFFAHLMVTAGQSEYDITRRVANNLAPGGIELARASYHGTFIAPELTIGTSMALGGMTLEPSARVRYAHLSLDGYSETGASDDFSVRDRDVSLWLGRLQLAMPITSEVGTLSPRVGVEAWSSDGDSVSAVLLGQSISFNPGGDDDEVTGFVGVTGTTNLGAGASAFIDGEIHMGEDGLSRTEARGGVKVSF